MNNFVFKNTCVENGSGGATEGGIVIINNSGNNRIKMNVCRMNLANGIYVGAACINNIIYYNTCYYSDYGILFEDNTSVIMKNIFYRNSLYGIYQNIADAAIHAIVFNNTCVNNGTYGIEVWDNGDESYVTNSLTLDNGTGVNSGISRNGNKAIVAGYNTCYDGFNDDADIKLAPNIENYDSTDGLNGVPGFKSIIMEMENFHLKYDSLQQANGCPNPVRGARGAWTVVAKPLDNTMGVVTTYTIIFTTTKQAGSIPGDGIIEFTFPTGFVLTGITGVGSTTFDGNFNFSDSGQTLTITRVGGTPSTAGNVENVIISNIVNSPFGSDEMRLFDFITRKGDGTIIDGPEDSNDFRIISPLVITKMKDITGYFTAYSNQTVMAVKVSDSSGPATLTGFSIGNLGTLTNGDGPAGIVGVKLWEDIDGNTNWSLADNYVDTLFWNGSYWTNDNISYGADLNAGPVFIVTIDLSFDVLKGETFQGVIPIGGIKTSTPLYGLGITLENLLVKTVPQYLKMSEPLGINQGFDLSSIAFGDYDNDGDLDLVVTGDDGVTNRFIIYRNDGGVYTNVQEPMGADSGVLDSSIAFGDYDDDGDLDIALTGDDGANPRFMIYRNDVGIYNLAQEPMGANQGVNASSIAFGDIDNDGDLDIALTGWDGATNRFIIYTNNGGIYNPAQNPMGTQGVYYSSIAFGDIDNDGDMDIALTGWDSLLIPRFIIYTNNGGTYNLAQEPMGLNIGVLDSSIAFGDYDDDGDLDIALTGTDNGASNRFIVYRNDGGTYNLDQEPMGINQGVAFSSIAFGDYDNDGDLDIALTGYDKVNYRFIIYRNDGSTYNLAEEPMGINQGVRYSSIAFGDYDNDGDLDIALTGLDSIPNYRFIIFRNNEGVINTPPTVPAALSATNVGGYWRLSWNQSTDDDTEPEFLR